eukprot:TRINITY_DN6441_c0_g1_i1.p1 TRINITY_DN6441_c0_g1~~TRINITY_DN6441_c0_g1_i1.p1  ORF type:complete len:407 (-),score=116.53 TRINITY_DN6441_c0_g1_i1:203-1423(-)
MKVLFTVLVVILASCVHFSSQNCSPARNLERTNSTIYFYDCCENNSTFILSKGPPNTVDWTLQGKRYKVLGSEECLPGQGWVFNGDNWVCNPDVSFTGDRLAQLILLCLGSNTLPVYNGTAWTCGSDLDSLRLLNCANGQTVKYNGTGFFCANDNDTLGQLVRTCAGSFVPVFRNGRFDCVPSSGSGSDTLLSLIPNCTNGYIPKYLSGAWRCALDNDLLRTLTCPAGQILKRTSNTTWGCGTDFDTFANLTLNCSALGAPFDTPVLTPTGWTCIRVPAINVSSDVGTVLYTNFYRFDSFGTQTDFFVGYYPVRTPYRGSIKAFGIRAIPVDGNSPTVNAYITINGVPQPSSTISRTFPADPPSSSGLFGLAIPISAQDSIDVFIDSQGSITFINVELYVELTTRA